MGKACVPIHKRREGHESSPLPILRIKVISFSEISLNAIVVGTAIGNGWKVNGLIQLAVASDQGKFAILWGNSGE